ncbi:MAG TPA: inositol monophosphatase family protein [Kofleriaceae bacterium]|jgi:myo-inositol-1(or 4)-monophosphatase|nr:inositol monophosphatase family protein [Kofleriaceae bacterium]
MAADREAADALAIARTAAAEAAALLRGGQVAIGPLRTKSSLRDLVTEWDTRCEELIRARLQALSPDVPIVGEEGGGDAVSGSGATLWLVDPIDGTVNFAHGLPLWAVTIALERAGAPVAGVVVAPALGWELHAALGGGAFLGDRPLHVSAVTRLDQALLATGFPYDRATNPDNNFAEWEHMQRRAGACRRLGAASLDLAMVAAGSLDGYWERRLYPWDMAAGALLVQEAGGRVTATDGSPFVAARGDAAASNGAIHNDILAELAAVRARREAPP